MTQCLIVDDSPTMRRIIRRIVERLDLVVSEAADGSDALARCGDALPDVILLDWNMPVMDGLGFLEALRRLPGGDRPVVVFCTPSTSCHGSPPPSRPVRTNT